jgi:hypothetical protein
MRQRIATAEQYLTARPGTIGFVLRDRATGATYRNANAGTPIWTASTIKLAMVADLLTRERSGALRLSAADRRLMVAMLRSSDNSAADSSWSRFGGPAQVFNTNFTRYGMPNVRPQPGFGDVYPYWGFQKATADDFDGLMNYVLTGLSPPTPPRWRGRCSESMANSSGECGARAPRWRPGTRTAGLRNKADGS